MRMKAGKNDSEKREIRRGPGKVHSGGYRMRWHGDKWFASL